VTQVSLVVAADARGGIGQQGGLPWHLPDDLKRFKALTMGKPIIMGRRTQQSIGRPLPDRRNIVISRSRGLELDGCEIAGSLDAALELAADAPEACVIGGAEIYRLALPRADVLYLTRVEAVVEADTFFPQIDAGDWEEREREPHAADERHAYPYTFITLVRRA
jgi:dihydrofolate reductase